MSRSTLATNSVPESIPSLPVEGQATTERVLVCVNGNALGARVLRAGRKLATSLRADWVAAYVETPEHYRLPDPSRDRLALLMKQAEAWGAETVTLPGLDIAHEIVRYARAHRITRIVVGKPSPGAWRGMRRSPLADELQAQAGTINVFVVSAGRSLPLNLGLSLDGRRRRIVDYLFSLATLALATGCGLLLARLLDPAYIALIYLVAVVLSATTWGLGPSILSSVLAVFLLDDLFIPPFGIFSIAGPRDVLTLGVFLLVAVVITELGSRVHAEVEATRRREQEIMALYALNREIAFVQDWSKILDAALKQIGDLFEAELVALLPDSRGSLRPHQLYALNSTELRAAQWAYDHREPAGRATAFFAEVPFMYLPLQTAQGVFGVLGLRLRGPENALTPDRRRLLETIAGQIAIALEHARLAAQAEQAQLLEASERFRSALLSSISHDLRTPLASIMGSVSSLLDPDAHLEVAARHDLLVTIQEEALRLNRLVGNLLNMTRLESGGMKPQRDWHSLEEVIGAALQYAGLSDGKIQLDIGPDLPLAPFDFVLMEQVVLNLVDNAVKYSPAEAPVEISACQDARDLCVRIADRGRGIPPEHLAHVFDKFYRVPGNYDVPGTGLGLSICKGIVEAHGGAIWAECREGGGTTITFTIPAVEGETAP